PAAPARVFCDRVSLITESTGLMVRLALALVFCNVPVACMVTAPMPGGNSVWVTGTLTLAWFGGTVAVAGRVSTAGLLSVRITSAPPGAGLLKVTVRVVAWPALMTLGLNDRPETASGSASRNHI